MEQQYKDVKEKYDQLLDVKQSLEKDIMNLQMLVEQERNNRSQASNMSEELESKLRVTRAAIFWEKFELIKKKF